MIEVSCTSCGKRYRVDDKFAGREAPCSACGVKFKIIELPPEEDDYDTFDIVEPVDDPEPQTAYQPETHSPPDPTDPSIQTEDDEDVYISEDDEDEQLSLAPDADEEEDDEEDVFVDGGDDAASGLAGSNAMEDVSSEAPTMDEMVRTMSPLGLAGLILGALALAGSYSPAYMTLPGSGLGFVLALIGLLLAIKSKRHGVRMPIAGMSVSAIAAIAAVVVSYVFVKQAVEEVQVAVKEAQTAAKAGADGSGSSTETSAAEPAEDRPAESGPAMMGDVVQRGDAAVKVLSVTVAPVELTNTLTHRSEKSSDVVMAVQVEVRNTGSSKVLDYSTWAGQPTGFKRDFAEIVDQDFNGYQRRMYGENTIPSGRVEKTSIAPGYPITDILLFKRPPDRLKYLELTLPGENIGSDFLITFRIPGKMIQR